MIKSFNFVPDLKRFISIVLTGLLVMQCMHRLGIIGLFYLNRDYIAAELCINRDKPGSDCKGKCHLKKQLAMTHDASDQENSSQRNTVQSPDFLLGSCISFSQPGYQEHILPLHNTDLLPEPFTSSLYRPPRFT